MRFDLVEKNGTAVCFSTHWHLAYGERDDILVQDCDCPRPPRTPQHGAWWKCKLLQHVHSISGVLYADAPAQTAALCRKVC